MCAPGASNLASVVRSPLAYAWKNAGSWLRSDVSVTWSDVSCPDGGGARSEVEVDVAKLLGVCIGEGHWEVAAATGSAGGSRGRRALSMHDGEHSAVANEDHHCPGNGACDPDEPSTTSATPVCSGLLGPRDGNLAKGQGLIVGS